METKTLGIILKGKSNGVFKNDADEYCHVSRFYIKNNERFQIIFSKGIIGEIAKRNAITTTSEKKVLKLLNDEGFKLI